jgi:RNA methyltransferase, TrmH family
LPADRRGADPSPARDEDREPSERITSHGNDLARRARSLVQRGARDRHGVFLVEGIRAVWQALDHHSDIEVIFTAPELLSSDAARTAVERAEVAGIRVIPCSARVFERFTDREHPSGLAAIVRAVPMPLENLTLAKNSLVVALYEVGNPGNLGTILRTLDAVGGGGLITIGDATDPYHPTAVKASMGTIFSMPIVRLAHAEQALDWARSRKVTVIGTSEQGEHTHWEVPLPLPAMILLGSEGRGLPPELLLTCDYRVRIPMEGSAGSLNLAIAAGILLYEARRAQWRDKV